MFRMKQCLLAAAMLFGAAMCHGQWIRTNGLSGYSVSCLAEGDDTLFAGTRHGAFRTTDDGNGWTAVNEGLTDTTVLSFAFMPAAGGGTVCFAGTGGGVFRSTNGGAVWTSSNDGLPSGNVNTLAVFPLTDDTMALFAGVYDLVNGGGIYRSTDGGAHWSPAMTGLTHHDVRSLVRLMSGDTPRLYAATYGGGVFLSGDNGGTWSAENTGLSSPYVAALAGCSAAGRFFAATNGGGVYRSTDLGGNWNQVNDGITNMIVNALIVCSSHGTADSVRLAAGSGWSGVFASSNSGGGWSQENTGLTTSQINALHLSHDRRTLFAGTDDGVWRRPLAEVLTDVPREGPGAPARFRLEPNYPNPFNASTTIRIKIPEKGAVLLAVHDLLGREVDRLMNDEREAGEHRFRFVASALPGGVYFARLSWAGGAIVRKMVLLK